MDKRRSSDPRKNTPPKPTPERKVYSRPRQLRDLNDGRSPDAPDTTAQDTSQPNQPSLPTVTSQASSLPKKGIERKERFRAAPTSQPLQNKRKSADKFEETGERPQSMSMSMSMLDPGSTKPAKPLKVVSGERAAQSPLVIVPLLRLKSDGGKIVMLVQVREQRLVFKLVTKGQRLLLQANVLATAWIDVLKRPCIHAPQMRPLSPGMVDQALLSWAAFVPEHAPEAQGDLDRLREEIAKHTQADEPAIIGVASESAPGFPIDKLLDANLVGAFEPLTEAPLIELQNLLDRSPLPAKRTTAIVELCQKKQLDECFAYISGLMHATSAQAQYVQRLKVILAPLGCAPAQAFVRANLAVGKAETAFKAWVASAIGTQAFVELACIDLVLGMEDRIVGRLPGLQNVHFHKGQLWCVDNAKNGPYLTLGNTDLEQYQASSDSWKVLDCMQLDVNLHKFLMKTRIWDADSPHLSLKLIATTLTDVLERFKVHAMSAAAPPPGAPQLLQRVMYLQERLKRERELWAQAEASLVVAGKSGPTGPIIELSRLAKTQRKLVNLRSDDIKLVHNQKKVMRKAESLDALQSALPALQAELAKLENDLKDDAALQKAKLELAAATFAASLHEIAGFIFSAGFVPSQAEVDILVTTTQAWLANPSTSMKGHIKEAHDELMAALASAQADAV